MATAFKPRYQDPFAPTLTSSPPVELSLEQKTYVREVLEICSSDSRFAQKAWDAMTFILKGGSVTPPVIASLNPGSVTVGDPSFTLRVLGSGFSVLSVIIFNGGEEVTTYVSDNELTTGVDMSTVTTGVTVPVAVISGEGVMSNSMPFVFQGPVGTRASKEPVKSVEPLPPSKEILPAFNPKEVKKDK